MRPRYAHIHSISISYFLFLLPFLGFFFLTCFYATKINISLLDPVKSTELINIQSLISGSDCIITALLSSWNYFGLFILGRLNNMAMRDQALRLGWDGPRMLGKRVRMCGDVRREEEVG